MARKYARDNRGRFAPAGAGATARGGRLKTASGNKRETQKIAALSGDRMSSVPKGAIGKTRKQREITMIDRPQGDRAAYNQGRSQQQAAIAARKARPSAPQTGSMAASKIEMNKGRVQQFTAMKKATDSEIRKVRQQIKDARSNATTFGAVPGLKLRLLELQSQSKRHRDTIASAKASTQK
jgi:hypothetical protein